MSPDAITIARCTSGHRATKLIRGTLDGDFQVIATARPGIALDTIARVIDAELRRLAAAPPSARELEQAQNAIEASFLNGLEPTLQRAIQLAEYDVLAKDPDYFAKDLARFRAVTAAQVKDAAAKYLKPTARVVLTISPGKKVVK